MDDKDRKITGKQVIREIIHLILYICIIIVLTFLLLHFVGQRTCVNGSSMNPSLSNGDNLIVDKLSYRLHDPERFDIIVFPFQYAEKKYYIKRIIGLPGEKIRIDDKGNIYINDKVLKESYGLEVIADPGVAESGITLGKDEYFVLGDNRNNSEDSRSPEVGVVKRDIIIGRAWLKIYPFREIGFIKHQ